MSLKNFDLKIFISCVILDVIDLIMDTAEQGGETIGIGGGIVEALGDFGDGIMVILGLGLLYKLRASNLVLVAAVADPILDEGIIPMYTGAYLLSLMSDDNIKEVRR